MVSGQTKISEELCIKRRLPHLAPGCKFSLGARSGLEKMEKEHNLAYVSKLKDDLEIKGTNGRQKTYEIFHVYCICYSGFMCQTTVIFGITKDGSLVLNTLAS